VLVGWADEDVGDSRCTTFSLLGLCNVNSNQHHLGDLGVSSGWDRFCVDLPGVSIEFAISVEPCDGHDCAPSTTKTLVTMFTLFLFP